MTIRHQRGATLLVSLIMLVVLTLFAVSMIRGADVSLRVVGNFQQQKIIEQGAWLELEKFISNSANFTTPATQPAACINGLDTACTAGYHVLLAAPTCINNKTAAGYTLKVGELGPRDDDWEVTATVTDPADDTKVYMRMVQGIRVRMLTDCP